MVFALSLAGVLALASAAIPGVTADDVTQWLFHAAGLAVNIYFPLYTTRRWYESSAGRALWIKALGNLIVIDMSLALIWFGPDYPGRDVIRIFGLTTFTVGMWYLLIVLLRSPRPTRLRDGLPPETAERP